MLSAEANVDSWKLRTGHNLSIEHDFKAIRDAMDRLSKAKRLTLDFEDDDEDSIEMQIPRAGEALAALKFCEENRK